MSQCNLRCFLIMSGSNGKFLNYENASYTVQGADLNVNIHTKHVIFSPSALRQCKNVCSWLSSFVSATKLTPIFDKLLHNKS